MCRQGTGHVLHPNSSARAAGQSGEFACSLPDYIDSQPVRGTSETPAIALQISTVLDIGSDLQELRRTAMVTAYCVFSTVVDEAQSEVNPNRQERSLIRRIE